MGKGCDCVPVAAGAPFKALAQPCTHCAVHSKVLCMYNYTHHLLARCQQPTPTALLHTLVAREDEV